MDLVQPFQYIEHHVVPGRADRFPDKKAILHGGLPCHARGLPRLDGGQRDISAQELLEGEEVVGEFGAGGEIRWRGWNNARVNGGGRWEGGF